jgi:glycosyltransferase involved in cell wall biosynthesis
VTQAPRAVFVYAGLRQELARQVERGEAPDTALLGENHLAAFGVEARIHESVLRRRTRERGLLHRLTWNARELVLPWEIRDADVLCTSLGPLVGPAARVRPGLRTIVFNMSLVNRLARLDGVRRRLVARSLRSVDILVCFAEAQRQRLLELTGADPSTVRTVPPGVDERFYAPSGPPPPDGHVLAVGRDLARDYRTFCAAVAELDAQVVLVASRRNLVDIEVPGNVRCAIDIGPQDLRELYRGARCVVVPTKRDEYPFGADCSGHTVVFDAFASGRPVVATRRATLDEYVVDGVTGLLVEPEAVEPLRLGIHRLLEDDERSSRIGAAGRAAVEREHTSRLFAQRVAGLIADVRSG